MDDLKYLWLALISLICNNADMSASSNDSITENSRQLDELVVTARKRLFKYSANKFEYDVAADSTLLNTNLLQAFRYIPILEVNAEGAIQSMEDLPVTYRLNGLKDPLLSGDITQVLRALPAALINRIEIKKIADQDRGTVLEINISTKSRLEGYRAQVSTYLTDQNWRNGLWGMSKIKRLCFSGGYTNTWIFGHNMTNGYEETRVIDGNRYDIDEFSESSPYKTDLHNMELSASYDIDDDSFLSLYGRVLLKTDPRQTSHTDRNVSSSAGTHLLSYSFSDRTHYKDTEYEASLRWEKTFKNPEHPSSIRIGYEFYNRPTQSDEEGRFDIEHCADTSLIASFYDFRHSTKKRYATNTLQAEWAYKFNNRNEIGIFGKMRLRDESWHNDVMKSFSFSPDTSTDVTISNTHLKEIYGCLFPKYAHYGKRWETTVGVLAQGYRHRVSATGVPLTHNIRWSFLPYARVAFITRNGLLFDLNYEMKMQVPDITALDPYRNTDIPGEVSYGNPHLKPQKSNNLELRISKGIGRLYNSLYLSYNHISDVILSRVFMSDGLLNRTFGNIGLRRSYNIGGYSSGRIFPKTFLRVNAGATWIDYRASEINACNSGWQWSVSARCEQKLPWNLFMDVNGYFNSSPILLQGSGASNFSYGVSLYKSFMKGSLSVSMSASSFIPLWFTRKSYTITDDYCSRHWSRSFHANFSVGLSYSFGKLQSQVKQPSFDISNNEIKKDYDE